MNASEVIGYIKQLSPAEQQKVIAYVFEMVTEGDFSEDFKRITDETFGTAKKESWASEFA
jgi:hypothetical protein